MTEEPPPREWLPEHLRDLRPDGDTPEQREEIRAAFKAHMAAADAYWTPERRAAGQDRHGQRMADIHAAEAVDPLLRWRRLADRAAAEAVNFERVIPQEGLAVYRERFDEVLALGRASRGAE